MKDIIITKKRQKTELITLAACFAVAFVMNIYAIARYDGDWSELFLSLGFVVTAAAILYIVWTVLRLIIHFVKSLFTTKNK